MFSSIPLIGVLVIKTDDLSNHLNGKQRSLLMVPLD